MRATGEIAAAARPALMRIGKKGRAAIAFAAVAIIAAAVAILGVRHVTVLTQLDRIVGDIEIATMLPPAPQDPNVIIVAVEESTLALFPYREPIDRGFLAQLLAKLDADTPRAVGLDVLFDQPTEPAKDAALKAAIARMKAPLFISYTDNLKVVDPAQRKYLDAFVPPAKRARAELTPDPVDGTVRWIYPGKLNADGSFTPGLADALARSVGIKTPRTIEPLVWHGRPNRNTPAFKIYPAQLVKLLPPSWFAGKIVLIGEIVSLNDRHRTPFAVVTGDPRGHMPGIEIDANAVSQLIDGRHSQQLGLAGEILLVLLLAMIGAAFGLLHRGLVFYLAIGAAALLVLWGAGFAATAVSGLRVPLVEPSLAFLLALWGTDAITGRAARRQREFIQSAFSLYLNPQMVKRLADDPEQLRISGEHRNLTLMFCDIRNFTALSERFDAPGLTRFVNRYMGPMSDAILAASGTIDKYIGDAIMAFWNAPVDDPAHAEHACRAALQMRAELVKFNAALRAEAEAAGHLHHEVRFGIGLNTGECSVGNMGTARRFNYTVLGDEVNTCSRLEGQSKTYGVDIVLAETTAAAAPGFALLELDLILVKGKTRPVRIHVLVGAEETGRNPAFADLKARHDAMLAAYRAQEWHEARRQLHACRAEAPELMMPVYRLYEHRLRLFEREPPPPDWDGVYTAASK
ncbi:MAG: CHASE2 domain-containing protein [Stellaceae bacterium]